MIMIIGGRSFDKSCYNHLLDAFFLLLESGNYFTALSSLDLFEHQFSYQVFNINFNGGLLLFSYFRIFTCLAWALISNHISVILSCFTLYFIAIDILRQSGILVFGI